MERIAFRDAIVGIPRVTGPPDTGNVELIVKKSVVCNNRHFIGDLPGSSDCSISVLVSGELYPW